MAQLNSYFKMLQKQQQQQQQQQQQKQQPQNTLIKMSKCSSEKQDINNLYANVTTCYWNAFENNQEYVKSRLNNTFSEDKQKQQVEQKQQDNFINDIKICQELPIKSVVNALKCINTDFDVTSYDNINALLREANQTKAIRLI